MNKKVILRDFIKCFKNKTNNQNIMIPSSKKMKKFDIKLDEILDLEIKDKFKKFGE